MRIVWNIWSFVLVYGVWGKRNMIKNKMWLIENRIYDSDVSCYMEIF